MDNRFVSSSIGHSNEGWQEVPLLVVYGKVALVLAHDRDQHLPACTSRIIPWLEMGLMADPSAQRSRQIRLSSNLHVVKARRQRLQYK